MRIFWALILKFVLFRSYLCINVKVLFKKIFIGPLLAEIGLFCVYSDYAEQTNFGELGKILFNFSNPKSPLYIC